MLSWFRVRARKGSTECRRSAHRPTAQEWGETRHFDPFCACRRPGTPHLWTACGFGLVPGGARRRAVYYQARPDKHGPRLRLKTSSGRGISSWQLVPPAWVVGPSGPHPRQSAEAQVNGPTVGRNLGLRPILRRSAPRCAPLLGHSGFRTGAWRSASPRGPGSARPPSQASARPAKTCFATSFSHWKLVSRSRVCVRERGAGGRRPTHGPRAHEWGESLQLASFSACWRRSSDHIWVRRHPGHVPTGVSVVVTAATPTAGAGPQT